MSHRGENGDEGQQSTEGAGHSAVHPRERKKEEEKNKRKVQAKDISAQLQQKNSTLDAETAELRSHHFPHGVVLCPQFLDMKEGATIIQPLHLFLHTPDLQCGRRRRCPVTCGDGGRDTEDGTDAQEETPEDGPQFRDQIKLHHFAKLRVVAGGVRLKL